MGGERYSGRYTVRTVLIYAMNRYNDRAFTDDQTKIHEATVTMQVSFQLSSSVTGP